MSVKPDREIIGQIENRLNEPPAADAPCDICGGTGVKPGTSTEDTHGDPCPAGCDIDRDEIERRRAS